MGPGSPEQLSPEVPFLTEIPRVSLVLSFVFVVKQNVVSPPVCVHARVFVCEQSFHFLVSVWITFLPTPSPGAANPCRIISDHGACQGR